MKHQGLLKLWIWCGRILPLTALLVLIFVLVFDFSAWINFVVACISIVFASFAFFWWWWVLDTVRNLYSTLNLAQERFIQVLEELKQMRKDLNDRNRKRNESEED